MNAPARTYTPKAGGTYSAKARERWGTVPDWIGALALQADIDGNQGVTAERFSTTASTVSALIGKTYKGRWDFMEAMVRGKLMSATVECPVKGAIPRNDCARYQKLPFSAANPERVQLYRACRAGCAHALGGNHAS